MRGVEIVACADIRPEAARARAAEFGVRALGVSEILGDDDVDLILNLTVPNVHFDISTKALSAGKHVFTEKPLATTAELGRRLVDQAAKSGLAIGSAPDTFLGAAGRVARRLVDAGAIGQPVLGTAFMMGQGMEHWHPDPGFYYQPGGGPVLDMGPYYLTMLVNLLGPIRRVRAIAGSGRQTRLIAAEGPNQGTSIPVGTPTSVLSLLEFSSGAMVTFGASWDVFRHSNHPIELHGTEGSLRLPDPDNFGGVVGVSNQGADWREDDTSTRVFGGPNWPVAAPDRANYRMLGLADLADALRSGRAPRASADLALHVLDVMENILIAAEDGEPREMSSTVAQPDALTEDQAQAFLA